MKRWTTRSRLVLLLTVVALVAAACGSGGSSETTAATQTTAATETNKTFTIGVSNTLVGNAWREQMVCAIKAEALASGVVDKVILANRNASATEQIADIQGLISQGVDAIIINPSDREALNPVIEEATSQGIVVVSIDQAVTAPSAYVATNDQTAYGELGARWLFEQLGGSGNVAYMRGIDGVPADTDRDTGFHKALEDYPGIKIVSEVFTGWDPSVGAAQALDILTNKDVDGIWTSGIDYTVVEQFKVADKPYVPVVGADNNGFIAQVISLYPDFKGAAVTNPPAIGGVGASIAIDLLQGKSHPRETLLTPKVLDMAKDAETLKDIYLPALQAGWSSYMVIEPWTHYTAGQVVDCKGPGE
ncbi:ABC transporter periplasmic-binding protein YtfQ precursor [bacterium BMS3Bbin01]|nr:ABC transporter periplasmic-binding protein YtfQ precursor [bacterium BMS3Bbin01]